MYQSRFGLIEHKAASNADFTVDNADFVDHEPEDLQPSDYEVSKKKDKKSKKGKEERSGKRFASSKKKDKKGKKQKKQKKQK